jgi:ferredoxin
MGVGGRALLEAAGLAQLIAALRAEGYTVVAPTLRDGAIAYDVVPTAAELPRGWTDVQEAGTYRVRRRDDEALFGYNVGPHSWKRFLHPPDVRLWRAARTADGFAVETDAPAAPRYAFLGVRACELRAIAVQDRVFLEGTYVDATYRARREPAFLVAVNCGQAGGTCFCVSMGTGPRAADGFDLALTELLDGGSHRFLVEVGSDRGAAILARVATAPAAGTDVAAAEAAVARAATQMGRTMDTAGIKELLAETLDHPRWKDVAERCLTCANCTMVCPTCFCTTVEDTTDLTGDHAERWRRWDSCFTMDFSYIHGGSVRSSGRSRYRQWLTHKLGTWIDQFGTSGCVGCGRCITWCPVGIDITAEVAALRVAPPAAAGDREAAP